MSRTTPTLSVRRQPAPSTVLLVSAFGAFLAFLDATIVNIAFPDIQADFPQASVSSLSWVLSAYNIVLAAFLVAAGRLADLLGRRRMFVWGVGLFTVASAACALAGSAGQLIAFRCVQGLGAALLIPASLALVVEGYGATRRAHGIGLWGASAAIASGLGPPIGGALVAASSWRLAFLVNVPLGILAMVVAKRSLVESRAPGRRKFPDLRGALLLALAIGALTTAVIKGQDHGWTSSWILTAFAVSMVASVLFVLSSRAHPAPILDGALLRIRPFAVGNLVTIVSGAGFYAYLLTHVLWLSYVWDYSLLRAGLAVAPAAFVAAVAAAVVGKVADRRGHVLVVVPGAVIWAAGLLWYLERVGTTPAFLTAWLPGQVITGIGVGMTLPVLASGALACVPGGAYATASAVVSSSRQFGAVLGVSILVVLLGPPSPLTLVDSLRDGWLFAACCFLVTAALTPLMGRTRTAAEQIDLDDARPTVDTVELTDTPGPRRVDDSSLLLTPEAAERLGTVAEPVRVKAGTDLFALGDASDAAYLVRSGRLAVLDEAGATIALVGRGSVVGELGLLTGEPRSATVRAVRDSVVLRTSVDDFRECADEVVLTSVSTALARRLQAVSQPLLGAQPEVVVAVLGAHDGAPVDRVVAELTDQLAEHLQVATPGRVTAPTLARLERTYDRVVLAARTDQPEAWQSLVRRVADRVIVVSGSPAPRDDLPRGCDLVLTGPLPTREQYVGWYDAIAPRSITVTARDGGVRPLAARLAGRSLGLVLAGGGARAFAHLGVLDVLEEAGVRVDRYAGTSVGAAVAALAATGAPAAEVDAYLYEYFVRDNPINDYALPSKGLIRGRKTVQGLMSAMDGRVFEELPHELRCVSVDLLARERVVHSRGLVADAVAASLRLPGLYPPYLIGDRLHVDGGVLDNLPVSTLQERPEGPVIAVNISFGGGGSRSGRTGPPRVPGIADTLMRTMMMSSAAATERSVAAADLVIKPSAAGVGLLEFHQIDRMRASGRRAAEAALPAVLALLGREQDPAEAPEKRDRSGAMV